MLFGSASRGIPSFGDLAWKAPVPNVTVGALSANTLSPASGVSFGQTLEKNTNGGLGSETNLVSLGGISVGDRVLVTGEASPKNGIWIITTIGSGSAKWKLTRATDADSAAELPTGTMVIDLALNALWTTTGGAGGAFIGAPTTFAALKTIGALEFYSALTAVAGATGDTRLYRSATKTLTFDDDTGAALTLLEILATSVYSEQDSSTSFTISGGGTATYSGKTAKFHRIGKIVVFYIKWSVTANGSGATTVSITNPCNLPQAAVSPMMFIGDRGGTGVQPATYRMSNDGTRLGLDSIKILTATGTSANLTGADLANGAIYEIAGAYLAQ